MIYLGLWSLVLGVSGVQAASIIQQTEGWCSPAVGQTGGNVTITCQGVDPKALDALNGDLGLTKEQLRLTKEQVELTKEQVEQKTKEANEWARKYHELLRQAEIIRDQNLTPQAKAFVHEGKLKEADALLRRSTIRMAQYHAIQEGMSYQEVVNILGRPGVETSRGGNMVNYHWLNPDGSHLGILFTNGQAGPKGQGGLR